MNHGRIVFSRIMDAFPRRRFKSCVDRYRGDHRVKTFTCLDQLYCTSFAQLTGRGSVRDIEACLRAAGPKLYHAGMKARVSRTPLAKANERRDWRICMLLNLVTQILAKQRLDILTLLFDQGSYKSLWLHVEIPPIENDPSEVPLANHFLCLKDFLKAASAGWVLTIIHRVFSTEYPVATSDAAQQALPNGPPHRMRVHMQ